jgi:hypothetical protein
MFGELEGVGQQVLQDLLQPLGIGDHAAIEPRIDLRIEGQLAIVGLVAERPRHGIQQVAEEHLLRIHRDGTGFDLGQIQDVGDEVQEVGAGAVDGAREFHLLGREIVVRIVG